MYRVIVYTTESGRSPLYDFLKKELGKQNKKDEIAQIQYYINNLSDYGFRMTEYVGSKAIKSLDDGIYELRPGNNRVLFFHFNENNEFVLLHAFTKKVRKTPHDQINLARKERDDYVRRNHNGNN